MSQDDPLLDSQLKRALRHLETMEDDAGGPLQDTLQECIALLNLVHDTLEERHATATAQYRADHTMNAERLRTLRALRETAEAWTAYYRTKTKRINGLLRGARPPMEPVVPQGFPPKPSKFFKWLSENPEPDTPPFYLHHPIPYCRDARCPCAGALPCPNMWDDGQPDLSPTVSRPPTPTPTAAPPSAAPSSPSSASAAPSSLTCISISSSSPPTSTQSSLSSSAVEDNDDDDDDALQFIGVVKFPRLSVGSTHQKDDHGDDDDVTIIS